MNNATSIAITGSSQLIPVTIIRPSPIATPSEVKMSVFRWRASASSATDFVARATLYNLRETKVLTIAEMNITMEPKAIESSSIFSPKSFFIASIMIQTAARKIKSDSITPEIFSILPCP